MNRPGRQELWDRFDGAVAGLAAAWSGSSLGELTAAFSELADVSGILASELRQSWRPARGLRQTEQQTEHGHPPVPRMALLRMIRPLLCATMTSAVMIASRVTNATPNRSAAGLMLPRTGRAVSVLSGGWLITSRP